MNLSDEIKSILSKYHKVENEIEQLLRYKEPSKENGVDCLPESGKRKYLSLEEAIKRNRKILKDLETAKGNLRSKAIYSPSEMQWENICKSYRGTPALPVTSWRCHCSVFV